MAHHFVEDFKLGEGMRLKMETKRLIDRFENKNN